MNKALLLFSGGLDSILAVKILKKEGVIITLLCFKSYFFDCSLAEKSAKKLGLKLRKEDFSEEHLRIVKKPKYGYGKNINPCIDCHLLMLRKAKKIMEKEGFDFLATGEVLGERPFSQNKKALVLIEKELGLENQVVRPLSAKLLPAGWIEGYAIKGKSRKPQLALAKKFKIKDIPSPAGGCILTDCQYAERLKELFKKIPECDGRDVRILRKGRPFWEDSFLIMIGRNEEENEELKKLKKKKDVVLKPENFSGPTALIRSFGRKIKKEKIKKAIELLLNYSKKPPV